MIEKAPLDTKNHELETSGFDYKVLSNPYERMNYVSLTDDLIAKMDGTMGEQPDFVIFLDKSARPVNWFVRELWDTLAAKDADGNTPKRPQSLFINIDGRSTYDESPEGLANLRALFSPVDTPEDSEALKAPSFLDDKKVLIVDEVSVSGDTIKRASDIVARAFPDAEIDTHSWMTAYPDRPGLPPNDNPRWYERDSDRYRSVVDRVPAKRADELKASDPRIQRGWDWLAKIPAQQDEGSVQLMHEIEAIGKDIKNGRLPYIPSYNRPDEEERIKKFSGLDAKDFFSFVRWAKQHYWPDYNVVTTITDKTGPLSEQLAEDFARSNRNARARRLRNKRPAPFDYVADPRTPEAKVYSQHLGLARSASSALAHHIKRT